MSNWASDHEMIRKAIKANKIPRDKVFIQTKLPIRQETTKDPMATMDRYRKELGMDYFDSIDDNAART